MQARVIYTAQYVAPFDRVLGVTTDDRLRVALIDDGVLSGVATAITRLQRVLGVPLDGVLGPVTLEAMRRSPTPALLQAYVKERAIRITRLVQQRPADLVNLTGWITRILSFLPEPR